MSRSITRLLWKKIPRNTPGIYTLGGGGQISKTTFLKKWMDQLLKQGVNSINIFLQTGELINETLASMPHGKPLKYIILDEITYIKD